MSAAPLTASGAFPQEHREFVEGAQDESAPDRKLRLGRIRNRLLLELLIRCTLLAVFCYLVFNQMGSDLAPYRLRFAELLFLFLLLPGLVYKLHHWAEARRAVATMWSIGHFSFRELSQMMDASKVLQAEVLDFSLYIDVMHDQIRDSLGESEQEVMKVIEQIGILNAQANEKRSHINRSIRSGKALTESTHQRVESNREVIAALEMQLREQNAEMHSNFERIEGLAAEVRSLTPLIKVITSIAQQTSLLEINSELIDLTLAALDQIRAMLEEGIGRDAADAAVCQ